MKERLPPRHGGTRSGAGRPPSRVRKKRVCVSLPVQIIYALKQCARRADTTQSAIIARAVVDFIDRQKSS